MERNEDPVAPWDTPEFKAKRETEDRLDRLTKEYLELANKTMEQSIKQAVTLPPPVIDWDKLRTEPRMDGIKAGPIAMDEVADFSSKQLFDKPRYETHEMDGVNVLTHVVERCQGRNCVVHNPSDHHMRGWPKRFHQPSQQTSRVCKHGLGHPDPDDVAYWQQIAHRRISTKHECDGCCTPKN